MHRNTSSSSNNTQQQQQQQQLHLDVESVLHHLDSFPNEKPIFSNAAHSSSNENRGFDPIDFLNHHYKTEQALITALPLLRSKLQNRITDLNESISSTIQLQSQTSSSTIASVTRAKAAVSALQSRIQSVQLKAQQSEMAVQEITQEMKRLDYAKQHLSKTITTLKRLHMLTHAVTQLRFCVRGQDPPDYKTAANLVDATTLLMGHFKIYEEQVDKIKWLKNDVDAMRIELEEGIWFGFWVVGFGGMSAMERREKRMKKLNSTTGSHDGTTSTIPLSTQALNSACLVLDALGYQHRIEFIQGFCQDHLEAYIQLFHPENNASAGGGNVATANTKPSFKHILSPTVSNMTEKDLISTDGKENSAASNPNQASLDQMERRYAWYRRMLRELDETFPNVFPKQWNMEYHLTHGFLTETGKHIVLLFSTKDGTTKHLRDRDCDNVTVLLKALQKTLLFEKEMTAFLQREYGTKFLHHDADHDDGDNMDLDVGATEPQIGVKKNVTKRDEDKEECYDDKDFMAEELARSHNESTGNKIPEVAPLIGLTSGHFENYMGPYIALEEQNMDGQLKESSSDKTVDTRGDLPVFTSSTNLFLYIKNSITRCTTLTKGKTLLLLFRAFQRTLRKYAKLLESFYPSTVSGPAAMIGGLSITGLTSGSSSGGIKDVYRIPPGEELTVCYAIDTCDYCVDTVEALQDLILDKVADKYKDQIDMSGEEEAFHDVAALGIRVLVSGLIQRTDQEFKKMSNFDWATLDGVGEESSYVRAMHSIIQPFVLTVKNTLSKSYFRNFCDQFAMSFTNAFYNTITRCKRINETGTQQLLLDAYNIKTLLLKLPVLENDTGSGESPGKSSTISPAIYTKMVSNQFQRIEILLKLVGTPSDLLIDNFKVQWQGGSATDLQVIMNLKGIKRKDQATLFEKFGVDPSQIMKGAPLGLNDNKQKVQALKEQSSDVAAKVNNDLVQMRQKVEEFRFAFLEKKPMK